MNFFEAVKQRVSVRQFDKNKQIPHVDLERIVDAARLAATARNIQPWEFVVMTDRARIEQLGAMVSPNGAFTKDAMAVIVVLSQDTPYFLEDGSSATQLILLACAAMGYGACWVAGDKKAYAAEVAAFVNAPHLKLISVIPMGVHAGTTVPKDKRTLSSVLHWERF
jgi:nitroreductase